MYLAIFWKVDKLAMALLYGGLNDSKVTLNDINKIDRYQNTTTVRIFPLLWRHNGRGSVSNHQPHDYLLNRLFRRRSKKTSKLRVTGLCAGNSPGTGEFPAQWPVTRKMFPFDDVIMLGSLETMQSLTAIRIVCFLEEMRPFNPRSPVAAVSLTYILDTNQIIVLRDLDIGLK